MSKAIDITGQRFGRLIAKEFSHVKRYETFSKTHWRCVCDCGKESIVATAALRSGRTTSCGCRSSEARLENIKKAPKTPVRFPNARKLKVVLSNMKNRCYDRNCVGWDNYGGRGIKICKEWRENNHSFYNWANANGYANGLHIDRIDVNGDYEPSNCRFVTRLENMNNTRANRVIEYDGKRLTVAQWGRELGWKKGIISSRLHRGWDEIRAITQPTAVNR